MTRDEIEKKALEYIEQHECPDCYLCDHREVYSMAYLAGRDDALEEAVQQIMIFFYSVKNIKSKVYLKDLVKVAKRIRALKTK